MTRKRVLTVFGTRPEAIKMVPVVKKLAESARFDSRLCVTAQHREMLDQVLELFDLRPEYDLDVMRPGQTLARVGAAILEGLEPVLKEFKPDLVLVHGDTSTSLYATLAAFYQQIPVGHVEAGLRTGNMMAPWPEEANRRLTGVLASLHFAPTLQARRNLLAEGVAREAVDVTGNTVVDALLMATSKLERERGRSEALERRFAFLRSTGRLVLVTGHRRESFGGGFERICAAIRRLALEFTEDDFLYPVHLNPQVREPVHRLLARLPNVHLIEPLDYLPFVYLLARCHLVLTDSGGLQEEAPTLGKPVLVMRETTERPEAVEAGTVELVGTDVDAIVEGVRTLMLDDSKYASMARAHNPYGDGHAAERIVAAIARGQGISMPKRYHTVSLIGLGYIGLPTAAALAGHGLSVVGVDTNARAVETVNRGEIHIIEPDLDVAVREAVRRGLLRATTKAEPADAFLIAVPTPFRGDHEPDLSYVEAAARSIAPVLKPGDLVVLESTSPVGTTELMAGWLAEERPDLTFPQQCGESSDIRVAHCPERVLPGRVLCELVENDRVIGGLTPRCAEAAAALYRVFVEGECIRTDARTAELCKLTENSFRDVNIAFANELSIICDKLGVDVWELVALANRHPRVDILQPGPGVGGHCIAVDPWFIVHSAPEEARLIRTARLTNEQKPTWVIGKVTEAVGELAEGAALARQGLRIACLGLAFKPNIDDLRESPALAITEKLARAYPGQVMAVEPNVDEVPRRLAALDVRLVSLDTALEEANLLVLLVNHREFEYFTPAIRANQRLVDTRGIWTRADASAEQPSERLVSTGKASKGSSSKATAGHRHSLQVAPASEELGAPQKAPAVATGQ